MRNPVIHLALLAVVGLVACEQKVDVAVEEEAIKAVIQKQLDAFRAFNYEGEAAVWAHEPYVAHAREDRGADVGWDSLSVYYKKTFEKNKELVKNEPDKYRMDEITGSNYDIHIHGDAAYVLYDEHSEGVWEGEEFSNDSRVVKHLEKKGEEWRIVGVF